MGVLVNRAALNFGVPMSCWFLVFPIHTAMSGSALCSPSCVFYMFQNTPYTSPEWLLAIYIPPIGVARLPFLHGRSCISGLDTFFRLALLPAGKRDFFGVLICLSRLLGWPKNAYALFGQGHHWPRFAAFHVLSRRFESTSWNLFPAILPCFQSLFVAFP